MVFLQPFLAFFSSTAKLAILLRRREIQISLRSSFLEVLVSSTASRWGGGIRILVNNGPRSPLVADCRLRIHLVLVLCGSMKVRNEMRMLESQNYSPPQYVTCLGFSKGALGASEVSAIVLRN